MKKKLTDITLKLTDEEYYHSSEMHHSALSTFAKKGFSCLPTLFDKKESEALLFGSLVDTMLTDGMDAYDAKYHIADDVDCPDAIANIVKGLFNIYGESHESFSDIPNSVIIEVTEQVKYQLNWKSDTRARVIREKGTELYNQLRLALGKTVVSSEMHSDALRAVQALRTAPNTEFFYREDNPFDDSVERVFQPVFRETIDGITYLIKPDELVVLHDQKKIIATDLKTTGKPEYEFAKSFIEWRYDIQSRLYYRVVRQALDRDPYFKDFELTNWYFIVVNKESLCPLVWEDVDTKTTGTLNYGKNGQIELKDPQDVAKELIEYLREPHKVPLDVSMDKPNSIKEFLNK